MRVYWSLLFTVLIYNVSLAQLDNRALGYFNADAGKSTVLLTWELNAGFICQGITIERREDDASEFKVVGVIKGLCGSPSKPIAYDFTDSTVVPGRVYHFRLILGSEGFTMSRTVRALSDNPSSIHVFPNPSSDLFNIQLRQVAESAVRVSLVNMQGVVVFRQEQLPGKQLYQIDLPQLPTGNYTLLVDVGGKRMVKRVKII
ncbi:MAG: T9SS type A sorting domain-containing protein [Cryomorphaceae bacterium]|nr:T9SS type A sorting domain-containing protein [Cryomorphaceae bacterium]